MVKHFKALQQGNMLDVVGNIGVCLLPRDEAQSSGPWDVIDVVLIDLWRSWCWGKYESALFFTVCYAS